MTADALLPVGRDCDCGGPLVWHHGHQWCAVYGSHTLIEHRKATPIRYTRPIDETLAMLAERYGKAEQC